MKSQVEGLAEALGWPFESFTVSLRPPWSWLPAHVQPPQLLHLGIRHRLPLPWPDLLISCGRRSAIIAAAVRRSAGRSTFAVHIQDPHAPLRLFDLVIPPRHDGLTGPNVIPTRAALHRVTPEKLSAAALQWKNRFGDLEVAVLLGGSTRSHRFSNETINELAKGLQHANGPVAVTPSRRTDPEVIPALKSLLPDAWFWDGNGANPYFAMLALARHIVVTEDSVSMTSEALTTGKPVYAARMSGRNRRLARFQEALRKDGVLRPFDGNFNDWNYEPVNETPRIAAEVRERLITRLASGIAPPANHFRT